VRRHLTALLCFAAIGAIAVAVASVVLPYAFGGRSYTVMSGSMEPRIHTGDVVAEEKIAPSDMRSGDIVTFQDPDVRGRMITHRVRSVREHDGTVSVVTKGDANTTVERWTIPVGGHVGRVRYRVAHVGYALVFARSAPGKLLLIVLPALLLGILELRRIWRRPQEVTA